MASQRKPTDPTNQDFIKRFNRIANHKHRYEVFADFIKLTAIALHNAIAPSEPLEQEYLATIAKYQQDEAEQFSHLLADLINLLEPQPIDILGQLYMELELSSDHTGQYFSPSPISQLLAKISHGNNLSQLADHAFITLSEPACGAGGMVLAFAKEMLEHGHNPAEKLWAQCIDIDRTAALMCYIQLSLWNIPAQIIVGNTLSGEYREYLYTPAHYLFDWDRKLRLRQLLELMRQSEKQEQQNDQQSDNPAKAMTEQETRTEKPNTEPQRPALSNTTSIMRGIQFDLFRSE